MLRTLLFLISFGCLALATFAQEETVTITADDGLELHGTLLDPGNTKTAVLIIVGSGPTDRNGNTPSAGSLNNCLKLMAEGLFEQGYASLRFDKRGVGESVSEELVAKDIRFEHFIDDAGLWIDFLADRYENVIVAGHSQGALVGMIAVEDRPVEKFISVAGLSSDAYTTIRRQLKAQPPMVTEAAFPILDSLRNGVTVDSVPLYLYSLLSPDLQEYLISFMRYDPLEEIRSLEIPILIIQGQNDIQVTTDEAKTLSEANDRARLVIIDGMNHVLKESPAERQANLATYFDPELPLHPTLVPTLVGFLEK